MGIGAENRCQPAEYSSEQTEYRIKQIKHEGVDDYRYSVAEGHNHCLLSLDGACFLYTIHFGMCECYRVLQAASCFQSLTGMLQSENRLPGFHLTRRNWERKIHVNRKRP